jgi:hypothetical protein
MSGRFTVFLPFHDAKIRLWGGGGVSLYVLWEQAWAMFFYRKTMDLTDVLLKKTASFL